MKLIDQRQRKRLPASGVGLTGPVLFAKEPLVTLLERKSSGALIRASPYALSSHRLSKAGLTRELTKAAMFASPLILADHIRVESRSTRFWIKVVATVSFKGDPDLFGCSIQSDPPARILKGTVNGQNLILTAQARHQDQLMLPYLLASEVLAIRQVLATQARAIAEHNQLKSAEMKAFVHERWEELKFMRPFARRESRAQIERNRAELVALMAFFDSLEPLTPADLESGPAFAPLSRSEAPRCE